jgi:thioredoxin-like negative regulator of GroEL
VGKILACCALCLAFVSGWQYTETQGEGTLLCPVSRSEIDTTEEELRIKYPKLYEQNTVVGFGADWCKWCPLQKAHLQALTVRGYRVAYFDIDDHKDLYEYMRGDVDGVPYIAVFVEGKIKTHFDRLTYWRRIARQAKECRIKLKAFEIRF